MKNWQFWMIILGLMQIHYDIRKSTVTLVITWILVGVIIYESWKEKTR